MLVQALIVTAPDQQGLVRIRELDDDELDLLKAIDIVPPRSHFRVGDLAHLAAVPPWLMNRERLPTVWQIRLIVSKWAYEVWSVTNNLRREGIWHDAVNHYGSIDELLKHETNLPTWCKHEPIIYAHGYPHALWPNSATWFSPKHLVQDYVRSPHENWDLILDAAHTEYLGITPVVAPNGFALDLAPDLYAQGHKLVSPFYFEEESFNTLSALGYEEAAVNGVDPRRFRPRRDEESGRIVF